MDLWEKCVDFHGHACGGLMIGYKASLLAQKLLQLDFSKDEDLVCVAENDSCSVDAIQAALGCSIGKGNLLFHMRGKQVYTFYNRKTGKSVRIALKPRPESISRKDSLEYYRALEPEDMFEIKNAARTLPERAKLFDSYVCEKCGELTGANWIRLVDGQKCCLDCCGEYDRFRI